jgi:GGDEF domain-containing protein
MPTDGFNARIVLLSSSLEAQDRCPVSVDQVVEDIESLAKTAGDVLIIGSGGWDEASLQAIRRIPDWYAPLIYFLDTPPDTGLHDGQLPSPDGFERSRRYWQTQAAAFNQGAPPSNREQALMFYLWVRDPGVLSPSISLSKLRHYNYPMLLALDPSGQGDLTWLKYLERSGQIEPRSLKDRIRLCTACQCSHLNFVDLCPSCGHLDIALEASLHCFTCGHVAPEHVFVKQDGLVCPNCHTRLRHIGSDYDRPLENQSCRNCRHSFAEARVEAQCLACGHRHEPDDLDVLNVHDYQLGYGARHAIANGNLDANRPVLELPAILPMPYLTHVLEIFRRLARRHGGSQHFTLIYLQLADWELARARMGEARLIRLSIALTERLKGLIRNSDLVGQADNNDFWLFFPSTSGHGARAILAKLHQACMQSDDQLEIRLGMYDSSQGEDTDNEPVVALLAAIRARASSHPVHGSH